MIRSGLPGDGIGAAGYAVANAIASANPCPGRTVLADCVNPVRESRDAWRTVARDAGAALLECAIVCSDERVHRHRIENRRPDIEGHRLPVWADVVCMAHTRWDDVDLVIDTAVRTPEEAALAIAAHVESIRSGMAQVRRAATGAADPDRTR